MAGEWTTAPLGEVSVNHDKLRIPVKGVDRRPGSYPYYGASGIIDHVDKYLFEGDYLLVAEDGENLRTRQTPVAFMATGRFWVNNHAHILTGNERALTRYLHYVLTAANIEPFLTGAVMPKLTQLNLNRIPVPLASLPEQQAIVEILGSLDDKIEHNHCIANMLKEIGQVLFKSWFVDFDPVHAKAEGRPTGLTDDLAALFPHGCEENGLPREWTVAPLSEMADLQRATINPAGLGEMAVDHYSLPAFDAGARPAVENASAIKSLKYALDPPLVLFSKLNPEISRVWPVLSASGRRMLASTEFLAMKPRSGRSTLAYLVNLLDSDSLRERAAGMVTGTSKSHQRVQPAALLQCNFIAPQPAILLAFANVSAPIQARIDDLRRNNLTLETIRNTLLPKLISSELRTKDAERIVGEAA